MGCSSGGGSSNGHVRPTMSHQRHGGYGGGYPVCGMGNYGREYDLVTKRPHREAYGMRGRRRAYDMDELDED